MGGVVDGGVSIDSKISPRQAAIEKAQAELRQEYDVREERRRELEFLEKGGNPLDFKLRHATSISVQSTSLTDQLGEQFVASEAKGTFALAPLSHGDSVESSGRPGPLPSREPNSADSLLLFDGENDLLEGLRNSKHPSRSNNIVPLEQSSHLDGNHNAVKSQAYARRNRSRSSCDSARAFSTDVVPAGDGNGSSSLPSTCHGSRDAKCSVSEVKAQKDHTISSICNSKSRSPNVKVFFKTLASDNQVDMEVHAVQAQKTASDLIKLSIPEGLEVTADLQDGKDNQHLPVDDEKVPNTTALVAPDLVGERGISDGLECMNCAAIAKTVNPTSVGELNEPSILNRDGEDAQNEDQTTAAFGTKGLDLEFSCPQISHSLDENTSSDHCPNRVNVNGNFKERTLVFEGTPNIAANNLVKQNSETNAVDTVVLRNDECSVQQNLSNNVSQVKYKDDICDSRTGLENKEKSIANMGGMESSDLVSETGRKLDNQLDDNFNSKKSGPCLQGRLWITVASSNCELPKDTFSEGGTAAASDIQICTGNHLNMASKAHEESILEKARTIEAKLKRIAQLSVGNFAPVNQRKSHWDFVLEEMAWLANDFMQERLWKMTAAAQICHQVAFSGRLRFNEQILYQKQRKVAHTLAKAIEQFWHSADLLLNGDDPTTGLKECKETLIGSKKVNVGEAVEDRTGESNMEISKHLEVQNPGQSLILAVQRYAIRYLKYNSSPDHRLQSEASTPDRLSDLGILEMSWEDQFTDENLFYTVLPGAMVDYRKSVESHWAQYEKTGSNMQEEEIETSMYDVVSDFGSRDNAYEEDEGETGTYYSPGNFEGSKSSKFAQKKQKILPRSCTARLYEGGAELPYEHIMENKVATQSSLLMGKRPPSNLTISSIPTKRVRTAARQRVLSPFSAEATGVVQVANKIDVSSGETSSFQDDQSTLLCGSQFMNTLEVESMGDFGKQSPFDCTEISAKPKKKKARSLIYKNSLNSTESGASVIPAKGSAYGQRWQHDSMIQNEKRDHSKKRLEGHRFEFNGNIGIFGQHAAKKPKIMKQSADTSHESFTPVNGSIPSPAASQMSNMSNSNKLIKMIAGRDRGRKTKAPKLPTGQSGLGNLWSLFEDQALVVLVHDMGPNWELVSDAINSMLHLKCIFRKARECQERHKIVIDRNGDGADSAEDSGSSQPCSSTLPGIPKAVGSARQLLQHLQGPMEEDTLKSHFEKIISIGKQQYCHRVQEPKQKAPVHTSHLLALSQVCSNSLNGGPPTPLDLCAAITSSPDILCFGYQRPPSSGLAISNQGSVAPVIPTSGANTMLQGSSAMVLGSSLPSPSAALRAPTRDGQRYGAPRPASLPIDEQQRMQQYNQTLSGRKNQQPGLSVPGATQGTGRGVCILSGGNGMGTMCGMNRGMPMPRPGFQGEPTMLNCSGSMLSSSVVGMPSPVNIHNGTTVSAQGNLMLGPHDALQLMRNPQDQRQMMMQELQMQVTQGNSKGVPPYNGLSTAFTNQTVPPPVQTFPVQHQMHPQQSHVLSNPHHSRLQGNNQATSPQQAYVLCLAKDRQPQQRFLHQQQQQHPFANSNTLMPHTQSQSEHPISSSIQNSSQIQQQVSSQSLSVPTLNSQHPQTPSSPMNPTSSQPQQKYHLPLHGHGRNSQAGGGSLPNQIMKQRQRQHQLQQSGRHHPQQRPQSQTQQQTKFMKVNGLSMTPGNQVTEKGEQVMHLMQGQGLFPGSGSNSIQSGKPLPQTSNQWQPQQKLFSRPPPPSSKQLLQMTSHPDNRNQGQVQAVSSGHILASQQEVSPLAMASTHQKQHMQPQQRQTGQLPHTIQKTFQKTWQMNSDLPMQCSVDHIQVSQQPVDSAFQMGTNTTMPQSCTELTSAIPVVSSASSPQWKAPKSLHGVDSPNLAMNLAAMGKPSVPHSVGTEPMPSPNQSLAQRQFSGSMPIHGHNVGVQWPESPQQQQKSPSNPPQQQMMQQQQRPPPSQQQQQPQPQQPQQHLPAGQGGLNSRPNSGSG